MKVLVNVDQVKARERGFETQDTYEYDMEFSGLSDEDREALLRCHHNRELQVFGSRLTVAAPTPEAVLEAAREALVRIRRQDELSKEWNNRWKLQLEQTLKLRSERAAALQRTVELAEKINRGELHPGLLFDDQFQLQCPSPLGECIRHGIEGVSGETCPPYPKVTPEDQATLESAIERIRAFQAAGKPMSATEDAAVLQPEPQDVEIQEALDVVSKIVLGEVNPASLFNEDYEFLGSDTLENWMLPGSSIEEHPLLYTEMKKVINQAAQRVFMARCRQRYTTIEERHAQTWLDGRRNVAHLEDVLARLGTPHQQARYRAGLLNLYEEAKPLLEEEAFAPLRPLKLAPYEQLTPDHVLTAVYGKGCYDPGDADPDLWLEGFFGTTDEQTDEERKLIEQIQTALPGSTVHLFRRRLGLEGSNEGEMILSRCRNRIEVEMQIEGIRVYRSFASPRGDYPLPEGLPIDPSAERD